MKNKGITLTSVTIVFLITILLFGGSLFLQYKLKNLKKELSTFETDLFIAQNKKSNSITLQNILENTEIDRQKITPYFIENETEIVSLLEKIEQLAQNYKTTPVVSVDSRKNDEEQTALTLNISIEGSFNEVYTYLLLLENFPVKASFSDLSIRKISDDPTLNKSKWSMKVLMDVKSYKGS